MQGLKQKILASTSVEAISELLNTGKTYEFASNSTRNSWKNASRKMTAYLKGEKPVVIHQEEEPEIVTPKKKRGNKKKENPVLSS